MLFNRRRDSFRFTEKRHSKKGVISMLCAIVLVIAYFLFVGRAYQTGGTLSMYYGSAGIVAILLSGVNMSFSVMSLMEENSYMVFPRISFAMSALAILFWLGTYIMGFII